MCRFKSGIILKNRIVLTPEGNESHSDLLDDLGIRDNYINATKTFVRAELIPKDGNKATNINEWTFNIDQDITPDWFYKNPKRYEQEFRDTVRDYIKGKFIVICGYAWTAIKDDEKGTYYLMDGFLEKSKFGKNNNYAKSYVREKLNSGKLVKDLKKEFGNRLVPIVTDLVSYDGFNDYGKVEGDVLAIPTLNLYEECRKKKNIIPNTDDWWWLATPYSTLSRDSSCFRYGKFDGYMRVQCASSYYRCVLCDNYYGIRPFFILKS